MKFLMSALFLLIGFQASALEVGEGAPCVVVNHVDTQGAESEHCIRDRESQQSYTLVEFFSITCSACQMNLPKLRALGTSITQFATTRMVSIDRDEAAVRKYITVNRPNLAFEIGLDSDRDAKRAYGVNATPTLFVLDQNYQIVYKHVGVLSEANITEIRHLVSQ